MALIKARWLLLNSEMLDDQAVMMKEEVEMWERQSPNIRSKKKRDERDEHVHAFFNEKYQHATG